MTLLSLRAGRLAVDIDPATGGTLTRFARDALDIMRPGKGTMNGACYPLVPFSNRIADGRFTFEGRTYPVTTTWPIDRQPLKNPMHGDGWSASWQVVQADTTSATIAFERDGVGGWPFRYRAEQSFRLTPESLICRMSLENREEQAAPGGIGFHPFFVREPDCELFFDADAVWLADADLLPTERIVVPAEWDFCHGRQPDSVALDNCFSDWDGKAAIVWPSRKLRLEIAASEPFRDAVVFTPPGRPFFCFEPVSHANGQIGGTRIAPAGTLSGEVVFRLFDV